MCLTKKYIATKPIKALSVLYLIENLKMSINEISEKKKMPKII